MEIAFKISKDLSNIRLDVAVAEMYSNCTRSQAADLISKGKILLSGQKKKPAYKVKTGDVITGVISCNISKIAAPEKLTINLLFEDHNIIVLNKESGMVVHPAPGNESGTLVNAVLYHDEKIKDAGHDPLRFGVVHRLDKDTSGVIVMAKTNRSLLFLQNEFKQRRVEKKYLALVLGCIREDEGEITLPIGRHPVKRKIMSTNIEVGKPARTLWKVKQRFKDATLVEADIKTGRTHQIRVHFYAIGYPVLGDTVYQLRRNRKKKDPLTARQMLHAHQISFRHPFSGKRVRFTAPVPKDFSKAVNHYQV